MAARISDFTLLDSPNGFSFAYQFADSAQGNVTLQSATLTATNFSPVEVFVNGNGGSLVGGLIVPPSLARRLQCHRLRRHDLE